MEFQKTARFLILTFFTSVLCGESIYKNFDYFRDFNLYNCGNHNFEDNHSKKNQFRIGAIYGYSKGIGWKYDPSLSRSWVLGATYSIYIQYYFSYRSAVQGELKIQTKRERFYDYTKKEKNLDKGAYLNYLLDFGKNKGFAPYFMFGIGIECFDSYKTNNRKETGINIKTGGGFKYFFLSNIGFNIGFFTSSDLRSVPFSETFDRIHLLCGLEYKL